MLAWTLRSGRLAGERLPPGTPVHLIDDLVFSGQTLRSARDALSAAGLDARTASVIVWTLPGGCRDAGAVGSRPDRDHLPDPPEPDPRLDGNSAPQENAAEASTMS